MNTGSLHLLSHIRRHGDKGLGDSYLDLKKSVQKVTLEKYFIVVQTTVYILMFKLQILYCSSFNLLSDLSRDQTKSSVPHK